jgi:peptidoglycan/LPS O-acetylase OafA/YrhL
VEEQFYLLWPFLLCLLPPAEKRTMLVLAVPVVVAPLVRSLNVQSWLPPGFPHLFGYWSFFSQFDLLAYGCLAALLFAHHRSRLESFYRNHPVLIPTIAVVMIAGSAALHSRIAGFYESIQGFGFANLLLQSVLFPKEIFFRPLNWAWIRHLGVLSYSIYIWQMMFCGTGESVFGVKGAWWVRFPAWIVASIMAAHASYYLLEKPLFRLRERLRRSSVP